MKGYIIKRSSGGQIGVLVTDSGIKPESGEVFSNTAKLLPHCVWHSPTGFETGYGGSGPADLALSILADFFGATPARMKNVIEKTWDSRGSESPAHMAVRYHQQFKFHFIAPKQLEAGEEYRIAGDEIASWLTTVNAGVKI